MTRVEGGVPGPDQRIHDLYAWIAVHPDGGEGIIGADMTVPSSGVRLMALITSKRDAAERLEPMVRQLEQSFAMQGQPFRAELRTFKLA